jgi:hypothetical protein
MQNSSRRLSRTALIALAALAALLLASCGGEDEVDVDLGPDPAALVPADAPLYVEAVVKPEGEVREDAEAALSRLLDTDDPAATIRDALDSASEEGDDGDLNFSEDVEPWLAQRVGVSVTSFADEGEFALVAAIADRGEAEAAVQRIAEREDTPPEERSYQGVDYVVTEDDDALGIVEDFVVAAADGATFESVVDVAAGGESLADNTEATEVRDDVPEERLMSVYAEGRAVLDGLEEAGQLDADARRELEERFGDAEGAFVGWGTAAEDAMALELTGPAGEDASEGSDMLAAMPQASWLAFAASGVGEQLRSSIEGFEAGLEQLPQGQGGQVRREIERAIGLRLDRDLDWIGDAGGFVEGTSILGLGGGLLIEATDTEQAAEAIDSLEAALRRSGDLQVQPLEDGEGFRAQVQGTPFGIELELRDDNVVIAAGGSSVADVLSPGETLADSDRFNAADDELGDLAPSMFLDFAALATLIDSTGQQPDDPDYGQFRRVLGSLDYAIAGGGVDGDRSSARFVLGLRENAGGGGTAATLAP